MNKLKTKMTEQTAKYLAIQEMAALLRETTTKDILCTEEDDENGIHIVHRNLIFNESEHETVKRSFLRLVSEL